MTLLQIAHPIQAPRKADTCLFSSKKWVWQALHPAKNAISMVFGYNTQGAEFGQLRLTQRAVCATILAVYEGEFRGRPGARAKRQRDLVWRLARRFLGGVAGWS